MGILRRFLRTIFCLLSISVLASHLYAAPPSHATNGGAQANEQPPFQRYFAGMPQPTNGWRVTVFDYTAYSVGYLDASKTPVWSAYVTFHLDEPGSSFKTRPPWAVEPTSKAGVSPKDIPGQPWRGYDDPELSGVRVDKGHMTPLADIAYRYGLDAATETFRMVNVVPQLAANNQGPWQLLESVISGTNTKSGYKPGLVDSVNVVWVITGPIFDGIPSWSKGAVQLPSGVPIPSRIFKVLLSGTQANPMALCFIMPNEPLPKTMETVLGSLVSIKEVEEASHLDLAPELSPDSKERANAKPDLRWWGIRE